MQRLLALGLVVWLTSVTLASQAPLASQTPQAPALPPLPPAATATIAFARDVAPILSKSCVRCHARGQSKGRFSLETREALLKGGRTGPGAIPGQSADSLLVQLVAGHDPDMVMPEKGSRLTAAEIGVLRAWIDQGVIWDTRVSFARQPPRNLDPRQPALPPVVDGLTHPVDRLLAAHPDSTAARAPRADDRVLVRRLHLDLVGVLPEPAVVDAFVADTRPDKVAQLAATLLDDDHQYAVHWLAFWNDLLRNDYRGPGYIDGGRRQISGWLYTALADNMPFDRFVTELVNPGPRSEGFTRGIVWRGVVNASQTPPMQAAQNVSQVFMGVNLKCASCHDSFINEWQLADAYGLAGVYADGPLEMVECDRPTGETAPLKFLYPSLGTIDAGADRAERVRQLAQVLVDRRNGRLSRTIVNRLWARLFGRGLVEPLDDMDQPAWHPDLLDWLAEDLVAHGYDLRHALTRLVTSAAYQRVAVDVREDDATRQPFAGPAIRRMTAEQFADAVSSLTGAWPAQVAGEFEPDVAGAAARPEVDASWIWPTATPTGSPASPGAGPAAMHAVRRAFELPAVPAAAALLVAHPRQFTLFVNGTKVAEGGGAARPRVLDVRAHLVAGRNVIALAVSESSATATDTPRALLVQLFAREAQAPDALVTLLRSDATWRWRTSDTTNGQPTEGWERPAFDDASWTPAVVVSPTWLPDSFSAEVTRARALLALHGRARSSLGVATPLTTALGRPGREQVVTVRADAPTTLQALELANGETFARLLRRGAEQLIAQRPASADALATDVLTRGLGRAPTSAERALAREVLGRDGAAGGGLGTDLPGEAPDISQVEDLLWMVVMLPEFRLIH